MEILVDQELISRWEDFFRAKLRDAIVKLADKYPKERSLYVNFQELEKYDPDLADKLLSSPDETLRAAEEAVQRIDLPVPKEFSPHIRIFNLPPDRKFLVKELSSAHIGKLIMVEGIVRQITTTLPKLKVAVWECNYCRKRYYLLQEAGLVKPAICQACGRKDFRLVTEESTFVDFQKIQIQEPLEYLRGGEQARYLDVFLEDDLTNKVSPGDRVIIVGILRLATPKGKKVVYERYLDAIYLEAQEKEFEEVEITPEEEKKIRELASDPNIYEKLVRSIAPSIYGYEKVKLAIALQLFGGVKKVQPDGTRIRGNIHILLLGDPGTGKSQLLEYTARVAPKSVYVAGKTTTGVGLTAAAERDEYGEGGWTLKAGALVLASGGIACIDEFDKISSEDRSALHEALEQQTVSIAKAGITTRFKTETSVLAAANPKFGRFDPDVDIIEQINIEPTLLSRFDLMFIIREQLDEERDRNIARHILSAHRAGEMRAQYEKALETEFKISDIEGAEKHIKPEIPPDLLRKYVAYARRYVFPVLTPEAMKEIEEFYVSLRAAGKAKGTVPVTARQLEALVRLAEASARVRLSPVVTVEDAKRAIELFKASMEEIMFDVEKGFFDVDKIATGKSASLREKMKIVLGIIKEYCEAYDTVPVEKVIEEAKAIYNLDPEKVKEIIDRLRKEGEIYEPRPGQLKPTSKG